jgi:hypothetical protein
MRFLWILALCTLSLHTQSLQAQNINRKTEGMTKMPGFVPMYWDAKTGKLWLEINRWGTEFLYVVSLPAGIGSNDIGLDRGQLGSDRIVKFERSGPKVLLVEPNYNFRAVTSSAAERRAVEDSFATSVLAGFTVEAEDKGTVLVDATSFLLRDAHGVANTLRQGRQGNATLDAARSAVYLPRTKAFPKNSEVEVTLTFGVDQPGRFLQEVAPTAQSITVRQHHSFIELPEPGYQPRAFDPRSGYYPTAYMDYATPVDQPIRKRLISRHRLHKKDPSAAMSEAVKPIVYYLDPGTPEPVRSALLDGARWWNQAFEAAGFRNAFQVEMLPEDADPMDVRYNLIQWVHRSTRGWSYGSSVRDPRTGEIIKGHVTLGSLRVRQDYLIAEGLLAPYESGKPANPEMMTMALARLRQLSAHEVGHTLGLSHNYVSSVADRASVMDYPHPLVMLNGEGAPDLSKAYTVGIGDWDKIAINYGYREFPTGTDEKKELDRILSDAFKRGIHFITDSDSRPLGSAHPGSHLWDNGGNAVDELERVMKVRAHALGRFGENNIREGEPWSTLEDTLVPVYLGHRYQTEAAAKVLGGLSYTYALRGDGQKVTEMVSGPEQRRALEALLKTLDPQALTLPERLLKLMPPRAFGYGRTRESFPAHTGLTFDPLGAAESAANLTASLVLNAERAARLIEYHARDAKLPGLQEVTDRVLQATWKKPRVGGLQSEVQRVVDMVVLYHLMSLATANTSSQVRAVAARKIDEIRMLAAKPETDPDQKAHLHFASAQIKKFLENPKELNLPKPVEPPPGQPIGDLSCDYDFDWPVR